MGIMAQYIATPTTQNDNEIPTELSWVGCAPHPIQCSICRVSYDKLQTFHDHWRLLHRAQHRYWSITIDAKRRRTTSPSSLEALTHAVRESLQYETVLDTAPARRSQSDDAHNRPRAAEPPMMLPPVNTVEKTAPESAFAILLRDLATALESAERTHQQHLTLVPNVDADTIPEIEQKCERLRFQDRYIQNKIRSLEQLQARIKQCLIDTYLMYNNVLWTNRANYGTLIMTMGQKKLEQEIEAQKTAAVQPEEQPAVNDDV
jgi:hypothetical protein